MAFRRVLQSRRIGALRDGAVETRLDDIGMPLGVNFLAAAARIVPYPLGRVRRFDVVHPQFGRARREWPPQSLGGSELCSCQ